MSFSSPGSTIHIGSDDDCWSSDDNPTVEKAFSTQVQFSPKIAYGQDSCQVHLANPWRSEMQNGFGVFLAHEMDCSSTVTVNCLDIQDDNQAFQLNCHTNDRQKQISCGKISLTFRRNLKTQEKKKLTTVQVVALAKGPCIDDDVLFKCPNAYNNSCIDEKLRCNGRSECPNGGDERDCHNTSPPAGVPIIVIVLLVLAFLFLVCVLSTVLICCCCRVVCTNMIRRFRPAKKASKNDLTITGEDAGLMKSLTTPAVTIVDVPVPQYPLSTETNTLIIDSTKPIYPRLA